jgi:hypothetical protein
VALHHPLDLARLFMKRWSGRRRLIAGKEFVIRLRLDSALANAALSAYAQTLARRYHRDITGNHA